VSSKRVAKKQPRRQSAKRKPVKKKPGGLRLFFRETRSELRKVSWPTRKEALSLTRIVVIVMVLTAIFLGGVDALFYRFFTNLFGS